MSNELATDFSIEVVPGYFLFRNGRLYVKVGVYLVYVYPDISKDGYMIVSINNKNFYLHRLMLSFFLDLSVGDNFVNFIDGRRTNCSLDNLSISESVCSNFVDRNIRDFSLVRCGVNSHFYTVFYKGAIVSIGMKKSDILKKFVDLDCGFRKSRSYFRYYCY